MSPRAMAGYRPAYGGLEFCAPDYHVQRDGFFWSTVEWVVAGRGQLSLNGRRTLLVPGTLFRYDGTTRLEIEGDPQAPLEKYFLCLNGRQAGARLDQLGLGAAESQRLGPGAQVRAAWDELIRAGQQEGATRERLCPARLEVLLLEMEDGLREGPGASGAETEFRAAKARIDAAVATTRRVSDLLRLTRLSLSQLNRHFRRWEGVSPAHYVLRQKMHLAAGLLRAEPLRIKEVAARVGFVDPYHFSRCFRRIHGVSPRAFRQIGVGRDCLRD